MGKIDSGPNFYLEVKQPNKRIGAELQLPSVASKSGMPQLEPLRLTPAKNTPEYYAYVHLQFQHLLDKPLPNGVPFGTVFRVVEAMYTHYLELCKTVKHEPVEHLGRFVTTGQKFKDSFLSIKRFLRIETERLQNEGYCEGDAALDATVGLQHHLNNLFSAPFMDVETIQYLINEKISGESAEVDLEACIQRLEKSNRSFRRFHEALQTLSQSDIEKLVERGAAFCE